MAKQKTRKELEAEILSLKKGIESISDGREKQLEEITRLQKELETQNYLLDMAINALVSIARDFPEIDVQAILLGNLSNTKSKINLLAQKIKERVCDLDNSLVKTRRSTDNLVKLIKDTAEIILDSRVVSDDSFKLMGEIGYKVRKLKEECESRFEPGTTKELLTTIIMAIKEE